MKKRLFTPGPTPLPEDVALRMALPPIHHRSAEFRAMMERVNRNLQYLFQTESPVLTLSASGTGGVEATFVSLFSPGDTVVAVNGGKFGERWVAMPGAFGLRPVEVKLPWGKPPRNEDIYEALRSHPEAKAVYLTHCETSSGTVTDVRTLAHIVRENSDALVCVDGISAVGAMEFRFDAWGIDVCVTGSQKGLMVPPGLSFVALSARAIAAMEHSTAPKFYLDLRRAHASWMSADTPWTPAVSLIAGIDAALERIRNEGIEQIWLRHERLARALRAGVTAVGLQLFSEAPSSSVTAVWLPAGIDGKLFASHLKQEQGITIGGGQGEFAGKIFRIAHMGYIDDMDILAVVAGLEQTLAAFGHRFAPGAGVTAAQRSLLESTRRTAAS